MMMLSVDPGIRGCGVAVWEAGVLKRCAYVKNRVVENTPFTLAARAMAAQVYLYLGETALVSILALEWPQVYRVGKQKGDNNDLLPLAGVQAAIATTYPVAVVYEFLPSQWKGQVPKDLKNPLGPDDIMGKRIVAKLTSAEREVFDKCGAPRSLLHNVIDSCGIGLKALERL
ncbi:MAG: hypothetical protein WC969_15590 [Elusimicrobiota bacterium]|jgi:hypothetical protein